MADAQVFEGVAGRPAAPDIGPARPPLIQLRNLKRARSRGSHTFELAVPDFTIQRGEFVALLGNSGSGKSTLLDLLALVLAPGDAERFVLGVAGHGYEGEVDIQRLWQRRDETELSAIRRRHLGYVLQTGGLLPFLTVRQNIELALRINRLRDDGRIAQLTAAIGLDASMLNAKPQFLSGGQRQRVAILRAIVHRPSLILADEPTAAVDKPRAHSIIETFRALSKLESTTVILVTHDRDLVAGVDAVYNFDVEASGDGDLTRSICRRR